MAANEDMTLWWHDEPTVGGDLDDARLRAVAQGAWRMRNQCIGLNEVFDLSVDEGETPTLCYVHRSDDELPHVDLHVGCGEMCPVMARIPYDGDSGGVDGVMALAISRAGADLLDLVHEVLSLRILVQRLRTVAEVTAEISGGDARDACRSMVELVDTRKRWARWSGLTAEQKVAIAKFGA